MSGPSSEDPSQDARPEEPEDPSRPLTIDDVPRLGSGAGIAIGCAMVVVAAVVIFWFIRGWLMHSL